MGDGRIANNVAVAYEQLESADCQTATIDDHSHNRRSKSKPMPVAFHVTFGKESHKPATSRIEATQDDG